MSLLDAVLKTLMLIVRLCAKAHSTMVLVCQCIFRFCEFHRIYDNFGPHSGLQSCGCYGRSSCNGCTTSPELVSPTKKSEMDTVCH